MSICAIHRSRHEKTYVFTGVGSKCRTQSNLIISRNILDDLKIVYNKYDMYNSNYNYSDDQPALVPV